MRVRNGWQAAVMAVVLAGAVMLPAGAAQAQGSAVTAPVPKPAAAAPAAPRSTSVPGAPAAEHVFTPPAVIGAAWTQALQAALDGVKQVLGADQLEAQQATASAALRPTARPDGAEQAAVRATPPVPPRSVPSFRPAWTQSSALREALRTAPVQPGPVAACPPTESAHDAHGEHATLLGASVALPWMVP